MKLFLFSLIGIQAVQAVQGQSQQPQSQQSSPFLRNNNNNKNNNDASSSSLRVLQKKEKEVDYTCYPGLDYSGENKCPTIQDGKCDNPNHDGLEELCLNQDCIDCNFYCQSFSADCYGCLNAVGCYYCEGDATCNNSNLYQSSNKALTCTTPEDFFLGGLGDSETKCIPKTASTQDPLSGANEWLFNMINIQYVWNTLKYTGKGIVVRINDDGVDINNKEFEGNNKFDEKNSCKSFEPNVDDLDGHGTSVAGIVLGNANNDFCSAGIAYDSTFSACNFFAKDVPYSSLAYKVNTFDISQNSIGSPACSAGQLTQGNNMDMDSRLLQSVAATECPFTVAIDTPQYEDPCDPSCDYNSPFSIECENAIYNHCKANYRIDAIACADFNDLILGSGNQCNYDKLPKSAIDALATGVTEGRNGKGIVFVFASGNKFYEGEDINMSGWTNSRYTITVGAVGKDGKHTDYSTPGAALMVTGPAGDFNDVGHIITAGLGGTCANSGSGTSFSCPVVSGVIALMLEARGELTWRDVQGIIASTSKKVKDSEDKSAQTNIAGVWHSDWYGFGIIDAKKAVNTALKWELWSPEEQAMGISEDEDKPIPNNGIEFVSELVIGSEYKGFISESVVVLLDLQHYSRGDLKVTLISPKGTQSVLHAGKRPEATQTKGDQRWKLMTVRTWGEDPTGIWKLKLQDLVVDIDSTTADSVNGFKNWKLTAYGRSDDVVVPTDAPTKATLSPTKATAVPTVAPTKATLSPTKATAVPTDAPTKATLSPTSSPTKTPVIDPTMPPTIPPTTSPTMTPTTSPTLSPTSPPTTPPTLSPTTPPTLSPTMPPTTSPTARPTFFALLRPSVVRPTDPQPSANVRIPILGSVSAPRPDPMSGSVPASVPAPRTVPVPAFVSAPVPAPVSSLAIPVPVPIPTPVNPALVGSFKPPHYNSGFVNRPSTASLQGGANPLRYSSTYTGVVAGSTSSNNARSIPLTSSTNVQTRPLSVGMGRNNPQTTTTTVKRMGAEETASVEDLSIVLEGVNGEMSKSNIKSIQTVLEEHTNSIVTTILPGIHFQGTVRVTSVTRNGAFPADYYNRKRHLRLDEQQQQQQQQEREMQPQEEEIPSVTIHYNELVKFDRLDGTEDMNGYSLASLALETPYDREEFVNKIRDQFNDDPVFQSFVGVSSVSVPPPTESEKSDESNNILDEIVEDEMNEDPSTTSTTSTTTSTIESDNVSMITISTIVIACWSVIGLGLFIGAMSLILKKIMRK